MYRTHAQISYEQIILIKLCSGSFIITFTHGDGHTIIIINNDKYVHYRNFILVVVCNFIIQKKNFNSQFTRVLRREQNYFILLIPEMASALGRVFVYGGKGALGNACVDLFKAKNWVR